MSLYSLIRINIHTKQIEDQHFYLKDFSWFQRGKVKEAMTFLSKELSECIETYKFQSYTHCFNQNEYLVFSKVKNDCVYISCATSDYILTVANMFLDECAANKKSIKELLEEYQNPKSKHVMYQIEDEVKETHKIVHQTLMSVLERNENLDALVAKSEHLSEFSKVFYKKAKAKNSCCSS